MVLVLGSLGCAGASASGTREHTHIASTIDQLENSARKERRKVRDLEYELARLESVMREQENLAERDDLALVPTLPVEVLEPGAGFEPAGTGFDNPADDAHQAADSDYGHDDDYQVVGIDEDGYEIVYVGEAAKDRSVTPQTQYLTRPGPAAQAGRAEQRQGRSVPAVSANPDGDHDRLEVTSGAGPTVDRQLAQARDANLGIRRPAVVAMPADRPAPAPTAKPTPRADDNPSIQYKRYYEALRAGNHEFAIAGFQNFIARYPSHEYADNARYWLAEAYYDKRDYKVALDEFRKVRRDYPTGNKVPDAMLKEAFCHIALGDRDAARSALQALMTHHPKSQPAIMAARRLDTLSKD